jgi:hypothetical protein
MIALIIGGVVGVLGVGFGARCYLELYKWARQCQRARIAVAYNNRVQLQAPLVEWLGWINQLDGDDASNGRVIYRNQKMSVSILKRPMPPARFDVLGAIQHVRGARQRGTAAPAKVT